MIVRIVSALAMADNHRDNWTWTGEVQIDTDGKEKEEICEDLYRFFNRVEKEDGNRLKEIGYKLPSLSVGDLVSFENHVYQVASAGFREITGFGLI